jgi:glutathione S-transferase
MELVVIVVVLALIQYNYFAFQVGSGRQKYDVPAPAISGNPTWERLWRVQMNTLEQLIVFLPAIWFFGMYVSAPIGACLGVVFIVARFIYSNAYVGDPQKRTIGFVLTFTSNIILLLGALIGAAISLA